MILVNKSSWLIEVQWKSTDNIYQNSLSLFILFSSYSVFFNILYIVIWKYLYIKPDILIIYRYTSTILFFCFTLLITFLIVSCFY